LQTNANNVTFDFFSTKDYIPNEYKQVFVASDSHNVIESLSTRSNNNYEFFYLNETRYFFFMLYVCYSPELCEYICSRRDGPMHELLREHQVDRQSQVIVFAKIKEMQKKLRNHIVSQRNHTIGCCCYYEYLVIITS
jgi:hypothetical protein